MCALLVGLSSNILLCARSHRTSSTPTTATPLEVEDNVSMGGVVPGHNLIDPTMLHGLILREVHDERSNTEEKRNDLRSKERHF